MDKANRADDSCGTAETALGKILNLIKSDGALLDFKSEIFLSNDHEGSSCN